MGKLPVIVLGYQNRTPLACVHLRATVSVFNALVMSVAKSSIQESVVAWCESMVRDVL